VVYDAVSSCIYVQARQKTTAWPPKPAAVSSNRVREVANQTPDANRRKAQENLLLLRDKITAELAKGDAAVMDDLQELFVKTRESTRSSSEP
jgi:hypothetical protein